MELTKKEEKLILSNRKKLAKRKKEPFLIRAEFSKLLTILCIIQSQLWTALIIYLTIKYQLDTTLSITILGFVFVGENVAIVCYFNKTKLYNAVRLKVDAIKEIYKITNDKDKTLQELSSIEDITDNSFNEGVNEDLQQNIN